MEMCMPVKRIGILTGGGDAPGLNAVIRAVATKAINSGYEVIGFEEGWRGLLEKKFRKLNLSDVEEIEWWSCEQEELSQKTTEEKRKVRGVIHSLDDWGNMIEFWYSIRNNLFHGAKNPENERDQFAVKYGYKTLKELMELLISERERN